MFFTNDNKTVIKNKEKKRAFYYNNLDSAIPIHDIGYTSYTHTNSGGTGNGLGSPQYYKYSGNTNVSAVEYANQLLNLSKNNFISNPISLKDKTGHHTDSGGNQQHNYAYTKSFNEDVSVYITNELVNNNYKFYFKNTKRSTFKDGYKPTSTNTFVSDLDKTPFFLTDKKPILFFNKIIKFQLQKQFISSKNDITLQFPINENAYEYQFNLYQDGKLITKYIHETKKTKNITISPNHEFYVRIIQKAKTKNIDNHSHTINIIDENNKILDTLKVITEDNYENKNIPDKDFFIKKIRIQTNDNQNLMKNSTKSWSIQRLQLWVKNKSILPLLSSTKATGFYGKGIEPKVNSTYSVFSKNAIISDTAPREDFDLYQTTFNSLTANLSNYTYRSGINELLDDNKQYIEVELETPIHYKDIQYIVLYSNLDDNRYSTTEKMNYIFNTSVVFFDNYNKEIKNFNYDLNNIKPNLTSEKLNDITSPISNTVITLKGHDHENYLKNGDFYNDTEYSKKLKDYYRLYSKKEPISNDENLTYDDSNSAIVYTNTPWFKNYMTGIKHCNFMSKDKVYYVNNDINEFIRDLK